MIDGVELTIFALDAELPLVRIDTFVKRLIADQDFFGVYTHSTGTKAVLMMGPLDGIEQRLGNAGFDLVPYKSRGDTFKVKDKVNPRHEGHRMWADWTVVHRHGVQGYDENGVLIIDPHLDYTLDDSEGDTEIWCRDCERDVTEELAAEGVDFDYL